MALIVPVLRVLFVSINIFETFKTLKRPPPSSRNGGHPSVRAMSQRKRAMKGCMTVWLVWCCYAIYEKTLDSIIGIFIPFYNEMKALILLFFMLTRARGAEPVYLHILRPMIKPYIGPLDSLLEITNTFGDLVILLCAIPYHIVASLYHRLPSFRHREAKPKDEAELAQEPVPYEVAEDQPEVPDVPVYGATRTRRRPLQEAQTRARTAQSSSGAAKVELKSSTQKSSHEIWYPPPPSYDESHLHEPHGLPTPPDEDQPDASVDEWRRYEPFPSAYPPTPLPPRVQLTTSDQPARTLDNISEEQSYYYSYIADDTVEVEEQGFQQSLQLPRENPLSAGGLSDVHHSAEGVFSSEDEMDYEEDDDDDFNVTLRTPFALKRVQNMSNATTSSLDRDSNISTGLSTIDDASPIRTRTNSAASGSSSSVAGRKRPLPSLEDSRPLRVPLKDRPPTSSQTVRVRPSSIHLNVRPPLQINRTRTSTSSSGTENSLKEVVDDVSSVAAKMRRVGTREESRKEPVRRTTIRPSIQVGVKESVVRRTASVTSIPRNTQPRAPTRISRRTDSTKSNASTAA